MPEYPELQLLVAGQWCQRDGQPVINPADESHAGTYPCATEADVTQAIEGAAAAFGPWRATPAAERAAIILKAVDRLRAQADEIGMAITLEQGKPLAQARAEVLRGCEFMEWDAGEGRRLWGRTLQGEPGVWHTALHQPIGPVAAITAWNFPMSTPARKVGAALAAGCSVVLKASEEPRPAPSCWHARCTRPACPRGP